MDIKDIRTRIDEVNDKILELFLERMDLSEEVVRYKIEHNLPIVNREREREILREVKEKAGDREEYAYRLFVKLMELSKASQREIMSGNTNAAAVLHLTEIGVRRALSVTVFADHENCVSRCILSIRIIGYHAHNLVILINIYTAYSRCGPAKSPCIILVEAAATSLAACKKDLAVSVCHHCLEEFVSVAYCDCDDTVCTRT